MRDEDILLYEPFEGDRDVDVRVLSDKMVVARRPHHCVICLEYIAAGDRVRARREVDRDDNKVATFYFCQACCEAMALAISDPDDNGRAIEARTAIGMRAAGLLPATGGAK